MAGLLIGIADRTEEFLRFQGLWRKKTLTFSWPQRLIDTRRRPITLPRSYQKRNQIRKTQTFPDIAFKLDFDSLLDRFRRQGYQECAQNGKEHTTVSEGRAKVKNGVSIALARADRRSGLAGNYKKRKIDGPRILTLRMSLFYRRSLKS